MKRDRSLLLHGVAVFVATAAFVTGSAAHQPEIELLDSALTPQIARQCFQEAQQLCERDAGSLWGVTLGGPILLADPTTRTVIASQADSDGLLTQRDGVFVGTLPAEETIAATAKEWAGISWVMLPWPLPKEKSERALLVAHEMFHRVQGRLELSATDEPATHLDTRDGRIWLRLEWRALQAALRHSDRERHRAIMDALTFRANRRLLFPDAATVECAQETKEGLAEYTGVRLSADSHSAAAERALKNFERAERWPTLTRSFAYVSGPAYGLLLDRAKPDWRSGLRASNDLGVLLQHALSISLPQDLATAAKERARAYEVEELIAAEADRAAAKLDRLAKHRQRFVTGPLLILPVHSMDFRFDPRDIQPLDDLGNVYPTLRVIDAWGILDVTGGALIAGDWSKVVVPAPNAPNARPLEGDGWTLELKTGWEVRVGKRKGDYIVERQ